MTVETLVSAHYGAGGILDRIMAGLSTMGIAPEDAKPGDLKPVDEFHIGGAEATRDLIAQTGITEDAHVLDIGSGIGGTPRFLVSETGCRVTGIDLTPEFVETARALSAMVGLGDRTELIDVQRVQGERTGRTGQGDVFQPGLGAGVRRHG